MRCPFYLIKELQCDLTPRLQAGPACLFPNYQRPPADMFPSGFCIPNMFCRNRVVLIPRLAAKAPADGLAVVFMGPNGAERQAKMGCGGCGHYHGKTDMGIEQWAIAFLNLCWFLLLA
jgi:hypothetical protein